MARVITVTDDEIGTTARIEIEQSNDGHVVRRIVVSADTDSGVPDHLMSALIPFIGLPAVRQPSNGHPKTEAKAEPERRSPVVPAFTPPPEKEEQQAVPAQRRPELESKAPVPTPAEVAARVASAAPKPPKQDDTPSDVGAQTYRAGVPSPSYEEMEAAIKRVGSEPAKLAEHFKVPRGNVYSWLQTYRKRQRTAASS